MSDGDSISQSFEVKVTLQIGARFADEDLILSFQYTPAVHNPGALEIPVPLRFFKGDDGRIDPALLESFYNRVLAAFYATNLASVERDLELHFADLVRLQMASDKMLSDEKTGRVFTVSEEITKQSEVHEKEVKESLEIMMREGRGEDGNKIKRSRHWTAITLTVVIAEAGASLRSGQFNYSNILTRIQKLHPDIIPDDVDSFKKLIKRLGIRWKTLKAQHAAANRKPTSERPSAKRDASAV